MVRNGRRAGSFREPLDMLVSRVGDPPDDRRSASERSARKPVSKHGSDEDDGDVHARLFERAWRRSRD